jgi:hypothetical protein
MIEEVLRRSRDVEVFFNRDAHSLPKSGVGNKSLLSQTGEILATGIANAGFAWPEVGF